MHHQGARSPRSRSEPSPSPLQIIFRMLSTTPFGRLTSAYCERQEIERHLVSFKYCGVEVRDVQTPESLHMVNNDGYV